MTPPARACQRKEHQGQGGQQEKTLKKAPSFQVLPCQLGQEFRICKALHGLFLLPAIYHKAHASQGQKPEEMKEPNMGQFQGITLKSVLFKTISTPKKTSAGIRK